MKAFTTSLPDVTIQYLPQFVASLSVFRSRSSFPSQFQIKYRHHFGDFNIAIAKSYFFFSFFIIINIECDVNLLIWVIFSEGSHNPFGRDFKCLDESEIMIFSIDKSVYILKEPLTDYAL